MIYLSFSDDRSAVEPDAFVFDGYLPEIMIQSLIGERPDLIGEGFAAAEKPPGHEWMSDSVIKSIFNHMGSVIVRLEPAS